jgi:hypothetical protein
VLLLFISFLVFSNTLSANGEQPVFSSRISEISEIIVKSTSNLDKPHITEFAIRTKVEILNSGEENNSYTESCIYYPRIRINAVFVNKSLGLSQIIWCGEMVSTYTYPPGITEELEEIRFYINQTGLTQLPDGNYTIYFPLPEGKEYDAIIVVTSAEIEIIYHSFYYNRTEENITETNDQTTEETHFFLEVSLIAFLTSVLLSRVNYSRRREGFRRMLNVVDYKKKFESRD